MVCKICGTELEEGAAFCHQCGERVTQQNVCPNCGKDLPDEAAFCMHCGMNLKTKEKFENEIEELQQELKKAKNFLHVERTEPEDSDLLKAYTEKRKKEEILVPGDDVAVLFFEFLHTRDAMIVTVGDCANAMKDFFEASIHQYIKNCRFINEFKKSERKLDDIVSAKKENEKIMSVFEKETKNIKKHINAIIENRQGNEDENAITDAIKKYNDELDKYVLYRYFAYISQDKDVQQKFFNKQESISKKNVSIRHFFERYFPPENPILRNCFITTAVCKSRHLPDDCHELTQLRFFRDTYMMQNEIKKAEVSEYYEIAPKICEEIDKKKNATDIYEDIWCRWLRQAVYAIDIHDNETAYHLYKEMVYNLREKYL